MIYPGSNGKAHGENSAKTPAAKTRRIPEGSKSNISIII